MSWLRWRTRGAGRGLPRGALLLGLAAVAVSCGTAPAPAATDLGRVPIPIPAASATPVTAQAGQSQLVAMGDLVRVIAATGSAVLVRAYGPDLVVPTPGPVGRPPDHALGTFTISVDGVSGPPLPVAASDFRARDDAGQTLGLTADSAGVTATPGGSAQFHLRGVLPAGHATLAWEPGGADLVVWDFEVELD